MTLTRMNRPKFTNGNSRESVVELSTHNQIPPNNTPPENGKMANIIRLSLPNIFYYFSKHNSLHSFVIFYRLDQANSSSALRLGSANIDSTPSTSRGMTSGSLMSLKSQDSIGTSSSICGDNVSVTSSTRRTSGSFTSAQRRNHQRQLAANDQQRVKHSISNTLTGRTNEDRETISSFGKRGSISSNQSHGEFMDMWSNLL